MLRPTWSARNPQVHWPTHLPWAQGIHSPPLAIEPMTDIEQIYYGRHRTTFRIGTYLALVRMMGVRHLVTALYGHTQLASETHVRLSRTRQTLRSLICSGFDSPAGRQAVQRLREVHRHIDADAEDYRYVLATFFLEPLRWNECHASAKVTAKEQALLLSFWMQVGRAMGIASLPETLAQWQRLQREYEARHMAYSIEGHRLARLCLRDVVKLTVPAGTQWMFRLLMIDTLEHSVRRTLGIPGLRWFERLPVRMLKRMA